MPSRSRTSPQQPKPPPDLPGRTLHLLLVEDSQDDTDLLLRELRREGVVFEHLRVETGPDLDRALRESRPEPWDVVISDYNLPGFDGFKALERVRAYDPDLPFIMVSGTIGEEIAVQSMRAGAGDYVMKGNLIRLVSAIRREITDARNRVERKLVEAALLASEAKYRNLIEQASDGIFVADRAGILQLVNSRYCRMFGYAEEELIGRSLVDMYAEGDKETVARRIADFAAAESLIIERTARRKDGTTFSAELSVTVSAEGLRQGIVRDVTARERARKVLQLEHAVARSLAEADTAQAGLLASIRAVCETEGWQCGRYFELDEAAGVMRFVLGWGADGSGFESFIAQSAGSENAPGVGLIGHVWQSGKPLWSPDIASDPRARRSATGRAGIHGAFLFPVVFEGRTLGVLGFDSRQAREPDERLLRAVEVIGPQIGQFVVRKAQQLRIARLSRLYAVLSGINSAIVRVKLREELFREACRIAVEDGKFLLAWAGLVDRNAQRLSPVASAGDCEGFVDKMRLGLAENDAGRLGLAGMAVRDRRPVIVNDMQADARVALGDESRKRGFRSLVMLPLMLSEEAVGVLALYADTPGFFDDEEMRLLQELAGDLSFALDNIRKEERLNYLAYYDALTGVANRTLFLDRLGQHLHTAAREKQRLVVLFFDVDRFKGINDSLGRQAGDALLKELASRMGRRLRDADDLARVSADHFAIVLRDMQSENDVARVVESLLHASLDQAFLIDGQELRVSAKIGIAVYPGDGKEAETLFRNAESAVQQAKSEGERYLFYTRQMSERIAGKLGLENRLRLALERDEFVLHYQPKLEFSSGRIIGVEALIRWNNPQLGLVPPSEFIPLLEETGLILEAGAWALRRAVRDHAGWVRAGANAPRIAVNVSPMQLRQRSFVESVSSALAEGPRPPGIDLELTESLIMTDIEANIAKLKAMRELGVGIAIDDFGTGYSSLSYLAKLPVQVLKIDRSFVIAMKDDPDTRTLVSTIIDLAHSLRLTVVAEGVDSEDQAEFLRDNDCEQMQGYLFSRPLPLAEVTALIRKTNGA